MLKARNLKSFHADAMKQQALESQNVYRTGWGNRTQRFWWVNQFEYEMGRSTDRFYRTVVH